MNGYGSGRMKNSTLVVLSHLRLGLYGWGIDIPQQFLPHYNEHKLDIKRIKKTAVASKLPKDSEVRRAIKLLGDDPKTTDLDNALFHAAYEGIDETVDILLRAGANPNYRAPTGWTPLLHAASKGYLVTVKALLEMGADPNKQDVFAAHTPLILAALYNLLRWLKPFSILVRTLIVAMNGVTLRWGMQEVTQSLSNF